MMRLVSPDTLRLFVKQQAIAVLATAVDYALMVVFVSVLGASPGEGAALGAFGGGVVGFCASRRWAFRATGGAPIAQAARYAIVSFVGLCANATGETLLVRSGLHYVLARTIVSTLVAVAWSFPVQRHFVFEWARSSA